MQQNTPLRVGVVGTGVMGGSHTRVAAMLPSCQLAGIYDADYARATQVAGQYGATPFQSLEALCNAADAVIVASPTCTHAEVGAFCLRAGCHVLLEKPIAASVLEGEQLLQVSKQSERLLMIGHIERFNPAVTVALSLMPQRPFAFELQRLSTAPGRDKSADIIFDLMIHDIDLALAFGGAPVQSIAAMGHYVRNGFIDHVTAMLQFANGATGTLTASAVSQERVRRGRFFTQEAQFNLDLASREVWIHRFGQSSFVKDGGQYNQASLVEQIIVPNREPLALEQEHFFAAIQTGSRPITDGEAGLEALKLAKAIQDQVNEQLVEHV